jgi:6-phosphogluconolactonase/glucosamine-6-phosphate isomerase/deaminase
VTKKFQLLSFVNADELARAAASAWLNQIEAAKRSGKNHRVALSGGRITQKFFASVVEQNQSRKISFANVHFFWAAQSPRQQFQNGGRTFVPAVKNFRR